MECSIVLPAIAKFSHFALRSLLASALSLSSTEDVGVRTRWENPGASLPTHVWVDLPAGAAPNCGQVQRIIAEQYRPTQSDEDERVAREQAEKNLIADLLARIEALEAER